MISVIQNTETFTNPKIELEQYCIDASSAVDIIYFAGFEFSDIQNRIIIDLGAGTGRLSIATAFFRAASILSLDIDWKALGILKKNVKRLGLEDIIYPICADVRFFEINMPQNAKITTIMNPPFGVQSQNKNSDRFFLEKAFSFSDVVYSIHLAGEKVRDFISKYSNRFGWKIDNIIPYNMSLEKSFQFHERKVKKINVEVYRFKKNK